ncbi:class A beta-lactamase-related serine hydrolase [Gramella sp. GC03-9]|uniref:Class A beta-lactamase-related serine hydrolase n=1 Tax=Christiangramia oceanisediminis TaxID=2920386 RepID=A0A9X2RDT1_9FLAO|nr:serine hydrolase [Gramella oceanisediminis]MCP9201460.1 class A beta-lactamase-related serine hydrolase [Gramella oceanisediminis]
MKKLALLYLLFLSFSLTAQNKLVEIIRKSDDSIVDVIMNDAAKYELQILYTSVKRNASGEPQFKEMSFRLQDSAYFYPASTVKLPLAILALEKINEMDSELSRDTPYSIEGDSISHTIADDIRQIFAVSDNDAYNRIFEFLGQDYIQSKLEEKGLEPVRISHRFAGDRSRDLVTQKISFVQEDGTFELPVTTNTEAKPLDMESIKKGKGYMANDSLHKGVFDFSLKNYFPVRTQQELMKRLFFPEVYQESERFDLKKEDVAFLKGKMATYPFKEGYDRTEFYDSYGKFFMFGDSKEPINSAVKIYNKVGYAYGTLTDNAYVYDPANGVEFFLTATLLVNENGIFNDGEYEYDQKGIPFLAEMGRQIYEYELKMKSQQ